MGRLSFLTGLVFFVVVVVVDVISFDVVVQSLRRLSNVVSRGIV